MPRGRPPLTDKDPAFLAKLRHSYDRNAGSMRAIARDLGISHVSASKYVREYLHLPVVMKDMRDFKPEVTNKAGHSCFDDFVRNNPNVKLPRSFSKMSKITGCSRDSLKFLFHMRRKKVRERLSNFPDIRTVNKLMTDIGGTVYNTKEIERYALSFDRWTFEVSIVARMNNGLFAAFVLPSIREFGELVMRKVSGDRLGWVLKSERETQGKDLPDLSTAKSALLNGLGSSRATFAGISEGSPPPAEPVEKTEGTPETTHSEPAETYSQFPWLEDQ